MAHAVSSSDRPAKLARTVATDWAVEWAEAKMRYESAEKALDAALKQEPRDSDVIQFLTQRMQNAQKNKELLLQRSQPSEAQ